MNIPTNLQKHFAAVAILVIFFLAGCQKEITEDIITPVPPTPVPPAIVLDSTYLQKIFYVKTNGSTSDTTNTTYYSYDAQKRVTFLEYTLRSSGISRTTGSIAYTYNGADTIPNKSEQIFFQADGNDTLTTFYTFSPLGKRVKDSFAFNIHYTTSGVPYTSNEKGILDYEYVGLNFYAVETYTQVGGNFPGIVLGIIAIQKDTGVVDASGNLLNNKRYAYSVTPRYSTATFTYDTHPNPFARISNGKTINLIPFSFDPIDLLQAKNNRVYAKDLGISGAIDYEEDLTGKYLYLPNGYPDRIILPHTSDTLKTIFSYTGF